jgi:cardiolipin synthase
LCGAALISGSILKDVLSVENSRYHDAPANGASGLADKWLGDGRSNGSWRETNVRFEGPAVRQLQAGFAAAWVEATGVMFTGRATLEAQPHGSMAAGLLYTAPTLGSTAAERFFALSIAAARKTLYMTNAYFAPDRNVIDLLAAAAQRGVDVRILTAGPRTDVNVVRLAGRAWYETLLGSGVRVYEWQPTTLHAKTFVVDGDWSTVGSMNFDNRSMALNDEATLMVLDRTLGDESNRVFHDDLRRRATWHFRLEVRCVILNAQVSVASDLRPRIRNTRGQLSRSIEPSHPTRAAVSQSPINA